MGVKVLALGTIGSTQNELRARVRAGEDVTDLCIRAAAQTEGVGRRGTPWLSPVGGSYQSVGLGRETWPWLTLSLGVGIANALVSLPSTPHVLLKWPNDLYMGGKKLGGILTEVVAGQVIVGVGVNVTNPVNAGATRMEGETVDAVSDAVLRGLGDGLDLARTGGQAVTGAFRAVDFLVGRNVEVVMGDPAGAGDVSITGLARGVDPRGALLVEDAVTAALLKVEAGHVVRFGPLVGRRLGPGETPT